MKYLKPGPFGFITFDFDAIKAATDWYSYAAQNAESGGSSATGVSTGAIAETNVGTYLEANGEWNLFGHTLRYNGGVRYIGTSQEISGPVTIDGATNWVALDSSYNKLLPSFNLAWDVADNWVVRLAASRTMTRPNPTAMLPNMSFGDPSASQATQGNPNLQPYTSDNIDLGAEWYTGEEGMVGLTLFQKSVDGFTYQGSNTVPFKHLGIAYENLNSTQQIAINQRGGPDQATVVVTQQVNADATLQIRGWEAIWVQPLGFVFDGLG